jgi:hypothetical protein
LIKTSLKDLYDFSISKGEIIEQLKQAKEIFKDNFNNICELIKTAKAVHADETGWRMDGDNWWLWVFVTNNEVCYRIESSRGGQVAKDNLGDKKDRVIISDGYAVYDKLPGDKQQCWVHLLRVSKLWSPGLYGILAKIYSELLTELTKPIKQRRKQYFHEQLHKIVTNKYKDPPDQKIQKRIQKHQDKLLTCLKYDDVLPENNTAERAIRPQVIMRKIFGGNRSPEGANIHEVNSSIIATHLKNNPNKSFFEVMMPLIKRLKNQKQK